MALDVEFAGNVYDENNNKIDCKYYAFWYNSSKWSDSAYDTELNQFSINAGSGGELTQDGTFVSGEVVILVFWQGGNDRLGTHDRFSAIKIVHDGSDTYVFDVQLLPSQAPSCLWNLPSIGIINEQVNATSQSSDNYQWQFDGKTFVQYSSWYGQTIFDEVGISSIKYDFGLGLDTLNNHTYDSVGDKIVSYIVANKYAVESTCDKAIAIKYHLPSVSLSNSPLEPRKNIDTTIEVATVDEDSRITSQVYYVDDVETEELTHSFDTVETHYFKVITYWNDGYEDLEFTEILAIKVEATPPNVTLTNEVIEDSTYNFTSTIEEGDGAIESIFYRVYYRVPLSGDLIKVFDSTDDENIEFTFSESGYYRIVVVITDSFSKSDTDFNEITLSCDLGECGSEVQDLTKFKMRFDVE